jgi:hypothetical protein
LSKSGEAAKAAAASHAGLPALAADATGASCPTGSGIIFERGSDDAHRSGAEDRAAQSVTTGLAIAARPALSAISGLASVATGPAESSHFLSAIVVGRRTVSVTSKPAITAFAAVATGATGAAFAPGTARSGIVTKGSTGNGQHPSITNSDRAALSRAAFCSAASAGGITAERTGFTALPIGAIFGRSALLPIGAGLPVVSRAACLSLITGETFGAFAGAVHHIHVNQGQAAPLHVEDLRASAAVQSELVAG